MSFKIFIRYIKKVNNRKINLKIIFTIFKKMIIEKLKQKFEKTKKGIIISLGVIMMSVGIAYDINRKDDNTTQSTIITEKELEQKILEFDTTKESQIADINNDGFPEYIIKQNNKFVCLYTANNNILKIRREKKSLIPLNIKSDFKFQYLEDSLKNYKSKQFLNTIEKYNIKLFKITELNNNNDKYLLEEPKHDPKSKFWNYNRLFLLNNNLLEAKAFNEELIKNVNSIRLANREHIEKKLGKYSRGIAFANKKDITIDESNIEALTTRVLIHELAHVYYNNLKEEDKKQFDEKWYSIIGEGNHAIGQKLYSDKTIDLKNGGWISDYSRANIREDIATLVEHYFLKDKQVENSKIDKKKELLIEYGFLKK